MVAMMSILLNGTFSVEYSIGDLTLGYEYQHEQEVQQELVVEQELQEIKVTELSRKANN